MPFVLNFKYFIKFHGTFLVLRIFNELSSTDYIIREMLSYIYIYCQLSKYCEKIYLKNTHIFTYFFKSTNISLLFRSYLRSKNGVVWLWHLLVNLYIWITILSCYSSVPLILGLIGRDGGLSTLCHSCGFDCQ